MARKKEPKLDENKSFFLIVILIFCVALVGISCFWLGTQFGENNPVVESNNNN